MKDLEEKILHEKEIFKIGFKKEWRNSQNKIPRVSSNELNTDKLIKLYKNARLSCDDSFYTFQKFYLEHKELYEEIVNNRNDLSNKYMKSKSLL